MLALHQQRCLLHSTRLLQIRTLRTLPQEIPTYIKRWDPTLHKPMRKRKALTESAQAHETKFGNVMRTAENEELCEPRTVTVQQSEIRTKQNHTFKKLRHLLRLAKSEAIDSAGIRRPLWKAYVNAKYADAKIPLTLSYHDWDVLWTTQAAKVADNRNRTLHLEELFDDMGAAGRSFTTPQRVLYLESLFLNGKEQEALDEWAADHARTTMQDQEDYEPEHLEIGVKLHALAGKVDRAQVLMDNLFISYPEWDSSVMMLVFRAHTSSDIEEHHDAAEDVYGKIKLHMAANITMKEYDACLVGFLEARHLRLAKQVFRDMVKDGHLATTGTIGDVEEVMKRLHLLYRLGTGISTMTSIALDAITLLPQAYHGHLFGDWMKSAVVQKAPEAATQILDMMFQRGYTPETFHFNMLLKALLRTKEAPNVLRAENIGWRMIDEARKAQKRKLKSRSRAAQINERADSLHPLGVEAGKNVPVANVTTFALIMHHHAKSLQWEHVDYLSRQLKEASITPNAMIMNVLIDNKCRKGAYAEGWLIYKQLTDPTEGSGSTGVFPDGATFRCLWKMLRLALGDYATRDDPNLPTPRELMKEMVEWWAKCRSRYDADRFHLGLTASDRGALTALVLHCFSYTQDLAGSLVSLHVLRHKFNVFPTDKSAQILQRQMAWVDMHREPGSVREQYFHSRSNKRNSERIAKIYQILLQRRLVAMDLSPGDENKFTDEEIGDMGLNLLSEFVRVVLKRSYPPEVVEGMIQSTKDVIGLPDLPTGDMDAYEVA
jgi:hypothetical protein